MAVPREEFKEVEDLLAGHNAHSGNNSGTASSVSTMVNS